jgi:hypothetical protein
MHSLQDMSEISNELLRKLSPLRVGQLLLVFLLLVKACILDIVKCKVQTVRCYDEIIYQWEFDITKNKQMHTMINVVILVGWLCPVFSFLAIIYINTTHLTLKYYSPNFKILFTWR